MRQIKKVANKMNAELLIRARKVFVEDNIVEFSETCPHCSSKGLDNKLRYFYLSLEEAIYKCQNANCLYPFERFIFKSLIDKSVYYYEEVLDGGREAYLRVPLDEHNKYEPQNPIATDLFCESQRNPDIEDYNFDFSDLFDDFETEADSELKPTTTTTITSTASTSSTGVVNPDALEFLDETIPQTVDFNAGNILKENDIDSIINGILDDSLHKTSPMKSPVKAIHSLSTTSESNFSKPNSEPKLSKCIQHIKKVKSVKNQKPTQKSAIVTAIRKVRKNQDKAATETSSTVIENVCKRQSQSQLQSATNSQFQSKSQPQPQSQSKAVTKPSEMSKLLKSSNFLRPTELAQKLGSLQLSKVNSDFLRNYMKAKEDKLFANEPTCTKPSNTIMPQKTIEHIASQKERTITNLTTPCEIAPNVQDFGKKMKLDSPFSTNSFKSEVSSKKRILCEDSVKKVHKQRSKKIKTEIIDNKKKMNDPTKDCSNTELKNKKTHSVDTKHVIPTQKRKAIDKNLLDTAKSKCNEVDANKIGKKKSAYRKPKSSIDDDVDSKLKISSLIEEVPVVRKQREQKRKHKALFSPDDISEQNPKHRRITKPKPKSNTFKVEIPLERISMQSETNMEEKAVFKLERITSVARAIKLPSLHAEIVESNTSTVTDSESSTEPLLGFSDQDINTEQHIEANINYSVLSNNPISIATDTDSDQTLTLQKSKSKSRSSSKSNKSVDQKIKEHNSKSQTSRQSSRKQTKSTRTKKCTKTENVSMKSIGDKNNAYIPNTLTVQQEKHMKIDEIDEIEPSESDSKTQLDHKNIENTSQSESKDVNDEMVPFTASETFSRSNSNQNQSVTASHYYRKTFKKTVNQAIKIDKLLNEWDDSENDQETPNPSNLCQKSNDNSENDDMISVISIASETSDSSFAFIGEPYYVSNLDSES